MSKSLMGTLFGLAVMALVSFRLEGTVLMGAWTGFLLGAGAGCAIVGWQGSAFRKTPARAINILAQGFMLKLAALTVMGLAIHSIPALAARLDGMAFLMAAAGGMFLLLVLGTIDNAKVLEQASQEAYRRAQNHSSNTEGARSSVSEALSEGTTSL